VNPDVHAKTRIDRKTLEKSQKKQQSTENQSNTKYRNISRVGAQFLLLACQGAILIPAPVSYATAQ